MPWDGLPGFGACPRPVFADEACEPAPPHDDVENGRAGMAVPVAGVREGRGRGLKIALAVCAQAPHQPPIICQNKKKTTLRGCTCFASVVFVVMISVGGQSIKNIPKFSGFHLSRLTTASADCALASPQTPNGHMRYKLHRGRQTCFTGSSLYQCGWSQDEINCSCNFRFRSCLNNLCVGPLYSKSSKKNFRCCGHPH